MIVTSRPALPDSNDIIIFDPAKPERSFLNFDSQKSFAYI